MTKRQVQRYCWLCKALERYGIVQEELDALLRCERTLSRWAEAECNGEIQRDEETGKPVRYSGAQTGKLFSLGLTPDREAAALKRATALAALHGLTIYHQSDPRGCTLYLIRPGDIPEGKDVDAYYTNGVAICID